MRKLQEFSENTTLKYYNENGLLDAASNVKPVLRPVFWSFSAPSPHEKAPAG